MILGPDTNVPETRCPSCKHKLDGAFGAGNNEAPKPGDVSICIECGNWMVFDPDMKLVRPSDQLLAQIKRDRNCQIAYHAITKLRRARAHKN